MGNSPSKGNALHQHLHELQQLARFDKPVEALKDELFGLIQDRKLPTAAPI